MQSDPIGLRGGMNTFGYVRGNPIKNKDLKGLDVWIEGPSGNEPGMHQSVNVGDPSGSYESYSYGVNGNWLEGEVYSDTSHGGEIERYKTTTPEQDVDFNSRMKQKLGDKSTYGYDDICRSYSQRQFESSPGVEIPVPTVREPFPQQIGISSTTTRGTSTTNTWTSK